MKDQNTTEKIPKQTGCTLMLLVFRALPNLSSRVLYHAGTPPPGFCVSDMTYITMNDPLERFVYFLSHLYWYFPGL